MLFRSYVFTQRHSLELFASQGSATQQSMVRKFVRSTHSFASNASPPYQRYQRYQNTDGENVSTPDYEPQDGQQIPHRLSNKGRPIPPTEVVSPIPETYERAEEGKEVVAAPIVPDDSEQRSADRQKRRRMCGGPLICVGGLVALVVVLALALGIGLGVGLKDSS